MKWVPINSKAEVSLRPTARITFTDDARKSYDVHQDPFLIGRSPDCHITLEDLYLSRFQAKVRYADGRYVIENMGTNPTLVNGAPIEAQRILDDGDRITVGRTELSFRLVVQEKTPHQDPGTADPAVAVAASAQVRHATHLVVRTASGRRTVYALDKQRLFIGRDESCEVRLKAKSVSRRQAEIYLEGTRWCIRDLNSANGTYLDGERIRQAALSSKATLQFGTDGPLIWIELTGGAVAKGKRPDTVEKIGEYYFRQSTDDSVGEHTRMIRQAFQKIRRKQSSRYWGVISITGILLFGSIGVALYQYFRLQEARQIAIEIFYGMKAMKLEIVRIEDLVQEEVRAQAAADLLAKIENRRRQLESMEAQYDRLIEQLDVLGPGYSEKEKLIVRMARKLGECELTMPAEFLATVEEYIGKWQQSPRLARAIRTIRDNGYAATVRQAMSAHHLPPQLLYLALQESDFNKQAVGPKTRFGIAKGIWQFIPSTARAYGLRTGPLEKQRIYDPEDERFHFEAATQAAARFLRDIYKTDAQASTLLVMAAYNWGPTRIVDRIRRLPENPKDRNFWNLLKSHKIPRETYDYVFYIVSAAVIGENPQLFGFAFENPLAPDTLAGESATCRACDEMRISSAIAGAGSLSLHPRHIGRAGQSIFALDIKKDNEYILGYNRISP